MEKKELLTYKPGTILRGIYKSYGRFGFLLTDENHEDVYIANRDSLTAVNNDTVEVKTMRGQTGRHNVEGKVLLVLERAEKSFVCTYEMLPDGGEARPIDEKIDLSIFIPEGEEGEATTGARVVAEVSEWPIGNLPAMGKVTEVIGYEGDVGVDIDMIIAQHKLPHLFSDAVLDEAEHLPQKVFPEAGIADFRSWPMVTIDGPDSKDLDDAVYCEKQKNGTFLLSVHIADVSRYVTPRSGLDREAYRRGTSVYLADRVIPMLPVRLSNNLCSLNHGEDRYAMSCIMEVSSEGKVTTKRITPSVIRVRRRCTYPEVNQAYATNVATSDLELYMPMLLDLKDCASALRTARKNRGALDFDFPEYKVILDTDGVPLRIIKRDRGESERIIEEAMIAANESVARFLQETGHMSVYRVHDKPDEEKLNALKRLLTIMDVPHSLPPHPEPQDMQLLLSAVKGKNMESVVEVMTLRSLPQACYSTENIGHFGIASSCYTHFTSPIRRYPDLIVHRLIKQALGGALRKSEYKKQDEFLIRAADHCSETEQNATQTERDVTELKMTEYMKPFVGEPFDATVTGITRFGIFVGLDNGVEGLIHVNSMDGDEYIYQEDTMTMKGQRSGQTFSLGMPVRVTLIRADKELRELDFVLGEIHSPLQLDKKVKKGTPKNSKKKKKENRNGRGR